MIGTKQVYSGLMRRSKSSMQSLCNSSGSDTSLPSASSRASIAWSQGVVFGQTCRSSSVSLEEVVTSSSSLQTELSFQGERSSSWKDVSTGYATEASSISASSSLVPYAILLAVALQLPSVMEDILQVLQVNFRSFPLLVVLGVFPGVLLKNLNAKTTFKKEENHSKCSDAPRSISRSSTIQEMEAYYKNLSVSVDDSPSRIDESSPPPLPTVRPSNIRDSGSSDEWGHFADFDEDFTETATIAQSLSRTSLAPLHECDEED